MCPRKQTTEPKLVILVSLFSGDVSSYTDLPVTASTYMYYGKYAVSFFLGHPVFVLLFSVRPPLGPLPFPPFKNYKQKGNSGSVDMIPNSCGSDLLFESTATAGAPLCYSHTATYGSCGCLRIKIRKHPQGSVSSVSIRIHP